MKQTYYKSLARRKKINQRRNKGYDVWKEFYESDKRREKGDAGRKPES